MGFLKANNVSLVGLAASVPKGRVDNLLDPNIQDPEKLVKSTGIRYRHIANDNVCTSDLCIDAARNLIDRLCWNPLEIDCVLFVTQTPDYILPATSNKIQNALGISKDAFCMDISLGCSGYVYALSVCASLMQNGSLKRGLILAGVTISKLCPVTDKSTYPLFGDAGTATALAFDEKASPILFHFGSDGAGYNAIIVEDGGFRNPTNHESFQKVNYGDGIEHSRLQLHLEGMDVFSFAINSAPNSVNQLLQYGGLVKDEISYFIFHQANLFMNERIRKKLSLSVEQVPYSLYDYANTSSATIPLTLLKTLISRAAIDKVPIIGCGFGVGLSWGSFYTELNNIILSEINNFE